MVVYPSNVHHSVAGLQNLGIPGADHGVVRVLRKELQKHDCQDLVGVEAEECSGNYKIYKKKTKKQCELVVSPGSPTTHWETASAASSAYNRLKRSLLIAVDKTSGSRWYLHLSHYSKKEWGDDFATHALIHSSPTIRCGCR